MGEQLQLVMQIDIITKCLVKQMCFQTFLELFNTGIKFDILR